MQRDPPWRLYRHVAAAVGATELSPTHHSAKIKNLLSAILKEDAARRLDDDRLRAAFDVQLLHDVGDVDAHRFLAYLIDAQYPS